MEQIFNNDPSSRSYASTGLVQVQWVCIYGELWTIEESQKQKHG